MSPFHSNQANIRRLSTSQNFNYEQTNAQFLMKKGKKPKASSHVTHVWDCANANLELGSIMPSGSKRSLSSQEDKDNLRRERNRAHARKTRERKKMRLEALTIEFDILKAQGNQMRQKIKAQRTAKALLGLTDASVLAEGDDMDPAFAEIIEVSLAEAPKPFVPGQNRGDEGDEEEDDVVGKRTKRNTNLPQEIRLSIRRERNKMHAKATRERKKAFLQSMELAIEKVNQENLLLAKVLGTSDAPSIMTIMASMKRDPEIMAEEQEKEKKRQLDHHHDDHEVQVKEEQRESLSGDAQQYMTSSNLKHFNDMNDLHSVSDDSSNAGSSSTSSHHCSSSASSSSNVVQHHTITTSNTPSSPLSSGISTPSAASVEASDSSSDNSSVNVWENGGIFDRNGNNFAMAKPKSSSLKRRQQQHRHHQRATPVRKQGVGAVVAAAAAATAAAGGASTPAPAVTPAALH
ncbi:hypothetical protein TrCOL_g5069 [Triparma columacea]|uniref:BZIP domain-containing protein n=1 Tax=Triparma columacea TaxID=722753 RepID=A0A9W7GH90_9STRA|nr:hypothetical protein TrCOL_g5069 [Triparma columacea]